jgi:hypothetical protein
MRMISRATHAPSSPNMIGASVARVLSEGSDELLSDEPQSRVSSVEAPALAREPVPEPDPEPIDKPFTGLGAESLTVLTST